MSTATLRHAAPAGKDDLFSFYAGAVRDSELKVLWITNMWPDDERPYYGTFIRSQAESLQAVGVCVDVLVLRGYRGAAAYAGAPIEIRQALRRERYDLVHIHTGHAALVSLPVTPRPRVVSYVGADLLGQPRRYGLTPKSYAESRLFRQLAYGACATITKSVEMESVLPSRVRHRNTVIPNGVDLDAYAPQPKQEVRRRLGWSEEERVVLFLGNPDDPRKNIALAQAAVKAARAQNPRLTLKSAWGVPPEKIPPLMWAADCLAFTSLSEGSPNVVKEAMAAALPIVATPVGDVPERLSGVAGCFISSLEDGPELFGQALLTACSFDRAPQARVAVEPLGISAVARRVTDVYRATLTR